MWYKLAARAGQRGVVSQITLSFFISFTITLPNSTRSWTVGDIDIHCLRQPVEEKLDLGACRPAS